MKELTTDIYYHLSADRSVKVPRLWHNCKKYKDRPVARVELEQAELGDKAALFKCSNCGFEYNLDLGLKLQRSIHL